MCLPYLQVSQESVSGGGAEEDTPPLQHVSGGRADEDTPLLRLVDLQGYNGDRSSEQTGTGAGTGAEGGAEREGTEEVDWSVRTVAVTSVELSVGACRAKFRENLVCVHLIGFQIIIFAYAVHLSTLHVGLILYTL